MHSNVLLLNWSDFIKEGFLYRSINGCLWRVTIKTEYSYFRILLLEMKS